MNCVFTMQIRQQRLEIDTKVQELTAQMHQRLQSVESAMTQRLAQLANAATSSSAAVESRVTSIELQLNTSLQKKQVELETAIADVKTRTSDQIASLSKDLSAAAHTARQTIEERSTEIQRQMEAHYQEFKRSLASLRESVWITVASSVVPCDRLKLCSSISKCNRNGRRHLKTSWLPRKAVSQRRHRRYKNCSDQCNSSVRDWMRAAVSALAMQSSG